MEVRPRDVVILRLDDGTSPFADWLESLDDSILIRAVDSRITRVRDGNFGDHKSVGDGVFELRIVKGPGLRVYYGLDGENLVILLGGGDKSTQNRDIKRATLLWRKYKDEN